MSLIKKNSFLEEHEDKPVEKKQGYYSKKKS